MSTTDQDDRSLFVPGRDQDDSSIPADRNAAARLMREQIDRLYQSQPPHQEPIETSPARRRQEPLYEQTSSPQTDHTNRSMNQSHADQWKHYHTQWQNYYQQYYERYYLAQLARKQEKHTATTALQASGTALLADTSAAAAEPESAATTRTQAVYELRSQLLDRVKAQSAKARGSKHFVPVLSALIVAFSFVFLQYNSLIFGQVRAYVSPGSINPANLVIDPTTDTKVGPEPKLIIPKINVDAPVIYDIPSLQESVIQEKLKKGVVRYPIPGATAMPGQKGNTVILGHSSNDVFDDGEYKFVFVQLRNMEKGDTFYLHYNGIRYTYSVVEKKIIEPTQIKELIINNGKPLATLVTCEPPGTALKRLLVIAEQISPDPKTATEIPQTPDSPGEAVIPGNAPTLFQRLFGQNR